MSEQTAVLESSAIEVPQVAAPATPPVMEVSRGPLVDLTPEQRKEYRATGELPKTEESAPSTAQGESGTPEKQVKPKVEPKPKPTAEERIAQLESTIERIRTGAGLEKPKAESEPAKPAPQISRPKPTSEDKNADGTFKYTTHEEFSEALLDWKWEEKEAQKAIDAQQTAQTKALDAKIEKARTRYENLDQIVTPAAEAIINDKAISPVIKQMLYDSDITPDLIYALASNKEEFNDFLKMAKENPGKAIRFVAITESLTIQALEGKAKPAEEPAKPKTQAPKPPTEAGGRAAAPPDSLQVALEGSGGKLNAGLKAEFLRRDLARLKS